MKIVNDVKKDIINKEDRVTYNIDASDYDMQISFIEDVEELTAKRIGYIERQIRNSYEYRSYVNYLKEELDLTKCSLLPGIDIKNTKVSLEFHHFPLTLFDITEVVARSMLNYADGRSVSTMDIAEVVVGEHYRNVVGLVPLTATLHEMAHNNAIVIPLDKINGNYRDFIIEYAPFIDEHTAEKVDVIEAYNQQLEALAYNKEKLKKRIVNYNVNYNKGGTDNVQET